MTQSSAELKKKLREVDHEIEEVLKLEVRSGRLEVTIGADIFNNVNNFQPPASSFQPFIDEVGLTFLGLHRGKRQ
jgi:hypothetical protein